MNLSNHPSDFQVTDLFPRPRLTWSDIEFEAPPRGRGDVPEWGRPGAQVDFPASPLEQEAKHLCALRVRAYKRFEVLLKESWSGVTSFIGPSLTLLQLSPESGESQ